LILKRRRERKQDEVILRDISSAKQVLAMREAVESVHVNAMHCTAHHSLQYQSHLALVFPKSIGDMSGTNDRSLFHKTNLPGFVLQSSANFPQFAS
jgi:hypothetical protein